jgi:hypothetical protein
MLLLGSSTRSEAHTIDGIVCAKGILAAKVIQSCGYGYYHDRDILPRKR